MVSVIDLDPMELAKLESFQSDCEDEEWSPAILSSPILNISSSSVSSSWTRSREEKSVQMEHKATQTDTYIP